MANDSFLAFLRERDPTSIVETCECNDVDPPWKDHVHASVVLTAGVKVCLLADEVEGVIVVLRIRSLEEAG